MMARERTERITREKIEKAERRAARQDRRKRYKNCRFCWRAYLRRYNRNCPTVVSNQMNWDSIMPCDRPLIDITSGDEIG